MLDSANADLDIHDLFLFLGTAGTAMALTVSPLPKPGGFHSRSGQYSFHAGLNGDARPEPAFRVTFRPSHDGAQPPEARQIHGRQASDRDAPGEVAAASITETLIKIPAGLRLWAGRAGNPSRVNGGMLAAALQCIGASTPFDVPSPTSALPSPPRPARPDSRRAEVHA
jgi:hypothetical protein